MVNPFILQATDAMTRIILGIHTLLLGTGGRGCCGPGIRTITATGCRERDTHRRAYGADAGRGGTYPPKPTLLPTLPLRPPVQVQPTQKVAASADMAKMPYRTFFITISLH